MCILFPAALTDTEIMAHGATFFLAGYDTTATALSFLLYNLAAHPDWQDKVYNEVNQVVGNQVGVDVHVHMHVGVKYICYAPFRQSFRFRNRNFPFRNQYMGLSWAAHLETHTHCPHRFLLGLHLPSCIVIVLQYLHIHYCSHSLIYTLLDAHSFKMGNWKLPNLKPNIDRPVPSKLAL